MEQWEGVRVVTQVRVAAGWAGDEEEEEEEEEEKKALLKGEGAEVGMFNPVCWWGGW